MASPPLTGSSFPAQSPPQPQPVAPPPPFFPPPVTSSGQHTTVIVIVFISFGALFLLGAFCFGCWFLIKKRKHKEKKRIQETEDIDIDEHRRVQELIVPGKHGPKVEMLSVKDEMSIHEHIMKKERDDIEKGLRSAAGPSTTETSGKELEAGGVGTAAASSSSHDHQKH